MPDPVLSVRSFDGIPGRCRREPNHVFVLIAAQCEDLERVQKRCMRVVYAELSYNDALLKLGLDKLSDRREKIFRNLMSRMTQ
jgi:hypothetical protein